MQHCSLNLYQTILARAVVDNFLPDPRTCFIYFYEFMRVSTKKRASICLIKPSNQKALISTATAPIGHVVAIIIYVLPYCPWQKRSKFPRTVDRYFDLKYDANVIDDEYFSPTNDTCTCRML